MSSLLSFLEHPTSNATIIIVALAVVVIIIIPNFPSIAQYIPFLNKVFKASDVPEKQEGEITMQSLSKKLDRIAGNHLHELPEMMIKINKIDEAVTFIKDNHGNRLTALETTTRFLLETTKIK